MEFFAKKKLTARNKVETPLTIFAKKDSVINLQLGYKNTSGIARLNIFFYTHCIFIDINIKTYILKPISKKQ